MHVITFLMAEALNSKYIVLAMFSLDRLNATIDIRVRGEMDGKRNDIHRIVMFDPCLRHVTS